MLLIKEKQNILREGEREVDGEGREIQTVDIKVMGMKRNDGKST